MEVSILRKLNESDREKRNLLLSRAGLTDDGRADATALVRDGDDVIAVGSREGNILKLIAVDEDRRGEDLTATLLTALRKDAFSSGYRSLFLYTKPKNKYTFSSLFFYPVAETQNVLLLEDRKNGIDEFVASLPEYKSDGRVGALVMNCNPFTKGHRYLVEYALRECEHVFLFVLSEDKSYFSVGDRLSMVKEGVRDLRNVTVLETGQYLISSATFPTYFLSDRETKDTAQCELDIEIFSRYFAPRLSISHRYVGTEPNSPLTKKYNEALAKTLPKKNITLVEIDRKEADGKPISASEVRRRIEAKEFSSLSELLPDTTIDYLREKGIIE